MSDARPTPSEISGDGAHLDGSGVPAHNGRVLSGTGFDNDTGEADPKLTAALADQQDEVALFAAVADARLLVPILAAPASDQLANEGLAIDPAELSLDPPV